MPETILIIDDDPSLPNIVRLGLEAAGYNVLTAARGAEGLQMLRERQPDLALLDVMMPTEYRLLLYLAEQPGRVLTTDQIYEAVWSMETDALRTNVKWYIWRLRAKIESDSQHPRFILTEPGVGYRLSPG
jgi:DNA-binding response OmpR family regulator